MGVGHPRPGLTFFVAGSHRPKTDNDRVRKTTIARNSRESARNMNTQVTNLRVNPFLPSPSQLSPNSWNPSSSSNLSNGLEPAGRDLPLVPAPSPVSAQVLFWFSTKSQLFTFVWISHGNDNSHSPSSKRNVGNGRSPATRDDSLPRKALVGKFWRQGG